MRKLVSDHTLTFPRLIWLFAMVYLYFINYPLKLLLGANMLLYLAYTANSFLYMLVSGLYLNKRQDIKKYIFRHWYICFLLPIYRFLIYWMRIAGIINSLTTESCWRTKTLSEEIEIVRQGLKKEMGSRLPFLSRFNKWMNKD